MQVLSTLPQDDLTLIMLKYQEDYTEEEIRLVRIKFISEMAN